MITFDQIQLLEKKVSDAVQLINKLTIENETLTNEKIALKNETDSLREEISLLNEVISELESQKSNLASEQEMIEKGIIGALSQLDKLVDGEKKTSEPISTSEETEIARQSFESSESSSLLKKSEEVVSEESGNQSEQFEISAEDSLKEDPYFGIDQSEATSSSFESQTSSQASLGLSSLASGFDDNTHVEIY